MVSLFVVRRRDCFGVKRAVEKERQKRSVRSVVVPSIIYS